MNQRCFFTTAPVFDLPHALEGVSFRLKGLGIDHAYWTVFEGVCSASAVIVGFQTGLKVVSRSDVKTALGAAKDVDVMHAPNMGKFELSLNRGEQEVPLDCSLRSRSRHHSPRGDTTIVNPYWLAMSEP